MIVQFTDDQLMMILAWLESQRDAGYTINDCIEGLIDGTATTSTIVSDSRYSGNQNNGSEDFNFDSGEGLSVSR